MKPVSFPAANGNLAAPRDWNAATHGECVGLPVHRDDDSNTFQSCWRPTWRERLRMLVGGRVWLTVCSAAHPPVAIDVL